MLPWRHARSGRHPLWKRRKDFSYYGFTAIEGNDTPKGQSIILLQEGDKPFGITVDEVVKMAKLEDPIDVPADIKGFNVKLVKGTRLEDDQEIIILGFERLFYAG